MGEVPKWIDDLIWCGKPVDPAKIEYPKDPPGVLGPNTIRGWQRTMAPFNAMNHYTPVRIELSPSDYRQLKEHIPAEASMNGAPAFGFRVDENMILPPSFAVFHYADKRVEMVKLVSERVPDPKPSSCGCRGLVHTCGLACS